MPTTETDGERIPLMRVLCSGSAQPIPRGGGPPLPAPDRPNPFPAY
jgi:hypothetical protein